MVRPTFRLFLTCSTEDDRFLLELVGHRVYLKVVIIDPFHSFDEFQLNSALL